MVGWGACEENKDWHEWPVHNQSSLNWVNPKSIYLPSISVIVRQTIAL